MRLRGLVLLGSVVVLSLTLLTLQTRGHRPVAADVLALVTTPVETGLAKVHRATTGLWSIYLDWKNVRAENGRLRNEVQRLRVEALRVNEIDEENDRLRRLLGLRQRLPLTTLSAEIIGREWGGWVRSLTVNRGRGDKIPRLAPVISPDGLVGRVVDVRAGASVIQVLSDPASTVSAHVVRSRTLGIVEGEPRGTIRQLNDLVTTSGLGGLFPRGIPIGRVASIDNRGSALFHYATLTPMVDFARVDDVLVLVGETWVDIAAQFGGEG
jgi:rod shape-determining protein MreC